METANEDQNKWLLKLERLLKTDIQYLIKGGSWLGVNQILSSLIAFALSLAFANLLAPGTYGVYKFILSVATILTIPTLPGIDAAVNRAVARKFEGTMIVGMKTKLRW